MAFLEKLKKKLLPSATDTFDSKVLKRKKYSNLLITDKDPNSVWEIIGELGDGAFGKVYKTRNKESGLLAAAKIVDKCSEEELDDYMIEIEILNECKSNEKIVRYYETYYYDQKLWLLIEYCGGGAVDTLILDLDKSLNELQIHYVCTELINALIYLHESLYVIHRDIKAGNILLTENGFIKLADFGVSAKNQQYVQKRLTFIGTPYWMAPEVIACDTDKENPYDYKADIWSLGITCIELAEKEPPHNELNANRVLMKIRKSDPPRLSEPNKWSKYFNDFVAKCLDKNPETRPSARELLKHPFITSHQADSNSMKSLLNEKNATVVNETIEEINEDPIDSDTESFQENSKLSPSKSLPLNHSSKSAETQAIKLVENEEQEHSSALNESNDDLPPPPELHEIENLIEPPIPFKDQTEANMYVLDEIFDDICIEVIKCDHTAPSIPDVILQVISDYLNEQQAQLKKEQEEEADKSKNDQEVKLNRNRARKTITRTFVVDGQTVTQKKIINIDEEERLKRLQLERKKDLLEHRRNLNEDKRKILELTRKQDMEKDGIEQDFKEQKDKLIKEFDLKLQNVQQLRKYEIERCLEAQLSELKSCMKKVKFDNDKLTKMHHDQLKDELKQFKRDLDAQTVHSKEQKELLKKQKEKDVSNRQLDYVQRLNDEASQEERRILKLQRQQLISIETATLLEKQNLIRTREAALWELEHRQMDSKFNQMRKHVRDFFYLQRHLMLTKQEKDLDHLKQLNTKLEDDLQKRQIDERRLFLKSLRQEQRSRREMYRRSLYIIPNGSTTGTLHLSVEDEKKKIKNFEEKEKERFESELQRLNIRHLKQLEDYKITANNLIKDLEEEQRLKRKQLVDAETKCVKDVDDAYNREYTQWQNRLKIRKQSLEDNFKKEEVERSQYYQQQNANTVISSQSMTSISNQHSYPFRTNSPNNTNGVGSTSSSSSEFNTNEHMRQSLSSMKIHRKDEF